MELFHHYFIQGFGIVRLNEKLIKKIGNDLQALPYAVLILILPPILNFFMASLAFRQFHIKEFLVLGAFILLNIVMFLFMSYLALNIFRAKSAFSYRAFFTNASLANVLAWILLIPFSMLLIGIPVKGLFEIMVLFIGIWSFIVFYHLIKVLFSLNGIKSFFVVLISIIVTAGAQNFLMDILLGEEYKSTLLNGLF